eukprot:8307083-Lingulodinium_polyedra.AAC.1
MSAFGQSNACERAAPSPSPTTTASSPSRSAASSAALLPAPTERPSAQGFGARPVPWAFRGRPGRSRAP